MASRDDRWRAHSWHLLRQSFSALAEKDAAARLDLQDASVESAVEGLVARLLGYVSRADAAETEDTHDYVRRLLKDWDRRAALARESGERLYYRRTDNDRAALLKPFGQSGEGWLAGDSMRSVEPNVAVEVQEPQEEVHRGQDQA
ncbi:hypothetical protein ACU686_20890 [Yinghuangia aomiensis]